MPLRQHDQPRTPLAPHHVILRPRLHLRPHLGHRPLPFACPVRPPARHPASGWAVPAARRTQLPMRHRFADPPVRQLQPVRSHSLICHSLHSAGTSPVWKHEKSLPSLRGGKLPRPRIGRSPEGEGTPPRQGGTVPQSRRSMPFLALSCANGYGHTHHALKWAVFKPVCLPCAPLWVGVRPLYHTPALLECANRGHRAARRGASPH